MRLALRLGIADYRTLFDLPASVITHWQAYYDLEPWDMENLRALAQCKYKPPQYVVPGKPGPRRRLNGETY